MAAIIRRAPDLSAARAQDGPGIANPLRTERRASIRDGHGGNGRTGAAGAAPNRKRIYRVVDQRMPGTTRLALSRSIRTPSPQAATTPRSSPCSGPKPKRARSGAIARIAARKPAVTASTHQSARLEPRTADKSEVSDERLTRMSPAFVAISVVKARAR